MVPAITKDIVINFKSQKYLLVSRDSNLLNTINTQLIHNDFWVIHDNHLKKRSLSTFLKFLVVCIAAAIVTDTPQMNANMQCWYECGVAVKSAGAAQMYLIFVVINA